MKTLSQLREKCWPGYEKKGMKTLFGKRYPNCVKKESVNEANAAAIAAATAISKKKSGNYDKEGMRKTPYKNPDAPNMKSNAQRRKEMNENFAGDKPQQVAGSAQATLTDKPNKEPMKTYKQLKNITELSTELLHRYKEKAAADASKADKAGNFERGNKRFSGVVKATNKQFANFKKKGFSEEKDEKEYDYEGEMVKSDLRSVIANANRLIDMLEDDDNLPEWCQNKITLAEDYISTVANYMTAEMNEEVEQLDEKNVPTNPGLWSRAKSLARSKFDVYPSAYANGWAAKWYKSKGGSWRSVSEEVEQIEEINQETKKNFIDRQKRLATSSAKTAQNPVLLAKLSRIPGYTDAMNLAKKTTTKEEVEQIDELSKSTLASYATKAADQARVKKDAAAGYLRMNKGRVSSGEIKKTAEGDKRIEGVKSAIKRLAKEEIEQIDEISAKTAMSYLHKTYDTKGYKDHSPQTQKGIQRATRKVSQDAMQKDYEKSSKAGLSTEETKPPFESGAKPKNKVIPGKYGKGYSTARHLARTAMQKQVEKMKKAPMKEETRKAAIVKDIMKKKKTASEDAFQKDPELSNTLTKL